MNRTTRVALSAALSLGLVLSGTGPALADPLQKAPGTQWAADTWRSMTAMVAPETGLPADNITGDLAPGGRARYTSPTNVASYIWSAVAAHKLHVIGTPEEVSRISRALDAMSRVERHPASGMFFNWYDPATLETLHTWPKDGSPVFPFLSSVDNAWFATALMIVKNAVPQLRHKADALLSGMDFAFYYDPVARGADVPAGLMRGGFWVEAPRATGS